MHFLKKQQFALPFNMQNGQRQDRAQNSKLAVPTNPVGFPYTIPSHNFTIR